MEMYVKLSSCKYQGGSMGAKDTKAKEYLSDNERFADLCNAVLFDGEQVIKAENLQEKDSTEVLSVLGTDEKEIQFQKWRDILKQAVVKSYGNMYFMLVGIEHQTEVHYAMPVRVMIYDALNYGAQIKEAAKKHRNERGACTDAEFLSGFYKEDRLTSVITITVYLGADQWDGPRSLHDMLQKTDDRIGALIPDYKIHLVIPQEIDYFDRFRTTLGEVLEVIKVSEDRRAMKKLLAENPKFAEMDNESVAAINTLIGVNIPLNKEGSVTNMCKAWEDQKEEGRLEEREQGRVSLVCKKLLKGQSVEQIADALEETVESIAKICEIANQFAPDYDVDKICKALREKGK